jgi:ketosteroid isomerase-like protein
VASTNLDLVRSIYAAWERGDFTSVVWADPDIEWTVMDGPDPGTWKGLAEMSEGLRGWFAAWEDTRVKAEEFRELDDGRILVRVHYSGRGRTSGLQLESMGARPANVFHLSEGKVTRMVVYFDRRNALADLGLGSEAGPQGP